MKLIAGKLYKVDSPRGRAIVQVIRHAEDMNGLIVDCTVVAGQMKRHHIGVRGVGDTVCLRPETVKWSVA